MLITEELFQLMKKEQIKEYYNTFLNPNKLVKYVSIYAFDNLFATHLQSFIFLSINYFRDVRLSILMLVYWPAMDRHVAIGNVEFHEFQNFVKYLMSHVYIQCLVQGNMTEEDVIKNVNECVKTLKCGPLLPNTMPQVRVAQIPIGTQYCKVQNVNRTDVNSVVVNYYQSGVASIRLSVIIELLLVGAIFLTPLKL